MPRGIQLVQLVQDLRAEAGHSQNSALGQTARPSLVRVLQRVQTQLYNDFDWPHLQVDRNTALSAGQRYYGWPTDLAYDRVLSVSVKYGGSWTPVEFGIGVEQMEVYDSDEDVRGAPVLRWAAYEESRFEVWPIPVNSDMTLRMHGVRALNAFAADTDTCDLDSDLILMFAAAELLAQQKNPKADKMLRAANALYARLRGQGSASKRGVWIMGGGSASQPIPGKIEIPFAPRGR